jgi:hypothetical protein
MPLSWNEIKTRALNFSRTWADASNEDSEAKPFWIAFFEIFGITDKRVATFELNVKKLGGAQGFVDLFWPGMLLVEQKSRGKSLDGAFKQALDYFPGIAERDLPQIIIVCDFARFRVHHLATNQTTEFELKDLHKNIKLFGFVAGYKAQQIKAQDPVNIKAAERMGRLHDALKASGYSGHPLEVLLVRLLFCLFADDTGIFQPAQVFRTFIEERTAVDGSDLGSRLAQLFQVLNTEEAKRSKALDEQLAAFPYINGKLFAESLPMADFTSAMREALLDACALDWSAISPAIFGSLFQSIMDEKARRNLGAHYTSEENILKLIKPLFLDELWVEFEKVKSNKNKLFEFHKKLRTLTFFDPACGCGNFLVISYRELRALELAVLRASHASGQLSVDVHQLIGIDVDQFYGIEIEEFPAQIAQVAMWLMDHQANLQVSEEFGLYFARIPLRTSPHVVHGNALRLDWNEVLPVERCSYVLGNPPFVGAKFMDDAQREDTRAVFAGIDNAGLLDFVAAWYVKAAHYLNSTQTATAFALGFVAKTASAASMGYPLGAHEPEVPKSRPSGSPHSPSGVDGAAGHNEGTRVRSEFRTVTASGTANVKRNSALTPAPALPGANPTRVAFVSTNSITQGEQVGVLWGWMLAQGMHIQFAHRTFSWSNEASGKAAVHCVIVGFGLKDLPGKVIFEYDDIKGEPHAVAAQNINPYLINATNVLLPRRRDPICNIPGISKGNQPTDGGHLILSQVERDEFLGKHPEASHLIKRLIGAREFLHGENRYCLWLVGVSPTELRRYAFVMQRIENCRRFRSEEGIASDTIALAATPTVFRETRNPDSYVVVPSVSSERRTYVPFGFETADTIPTNLCLIIENAKLFEFGVLSSIMHNAWMRFTCGRLESRYRYSKDIVYNNFPWPELPQSSKQNQPKALLDKAQAAIEIAAQAVLDVRAKFQTGTQPATLADLYDPLTMPPELLKAHQKLDAAVDKAYEASGGKKSYKSDAERVAFLFELYQKYTSLLPADKPKRRAAASRAG